jgi:hypothetical protein
MDERTGRSFDDLAVTVVRLETGRHSRRAIRNRTQHSAFVFVEPTLRDIHLSTMAMFGQGHTLTTSCLCVVVHFGLHGHETMLLCGTFLFCDFINNLEDRPGTTEQLSLHNLPFPQTNIRPQKHIRNTKNLTQDYF